MAVSTVGSGLMFQVKCGLVGACAQTAGSAVRAQDTGYESKETLDMATTNPTVLPLLPASSFLARRTLRESQHLSV